jgi:two-component system, OmpR family, phosphate regulon sensor histidine kinase PhoR
VQEGYGNEIQRILILTVVMGIVGFATGFTQLAIIIGLAGYILYSLRNSRKLYQWLARDANDMPPEMSGILGDFSDEFYRCRQRVEQAKRNYTALALRIRQITSAVDDGMILLNADRTLDWWNPSATNLLHFKDRDQGEVISNLIRNPTFVRFIHGTTFDQPLEMRSPQDPNRIFLFMGGTFGRGEVILMVRDVTRLRNLEEMRKEFVANISHELRTPLTVLTGYLETLQDSTVEVPATWQRALTQMEQQTRRLNALTEDLVMLSRLESSPPESHRQQVDLHNLLHSIVDNARVVSLDTHEVTLECEDDIEIPGSSQELHSAFSNLVFNAIRHNPQGCDIHVRCYRHLDDIVVEVRDTGSGIDSKHLPRLTERFYRVDDSRTTASGGTGLGLAIVKHVLGRHQGKLSITSTLGKGSSFVCTFKEPDSGNGSA